jgi:hypothetical protein
MKVLSAIALLTLLAAPAAAQTGNIHGTESRGEPFNSSYRASGVDPATGYTPGRTAGARSAYTVRAQSTLKKKKIQRAPVSTSGRGY